MLALTRHLQPQLLERLHHVLAVADLPRRGPLDQVLAQLPPVAFLRLLPCPALGGFPQRLVPQRPHQPDPLRIVRPRPAVLVVQRVPERVVETLPARRRDVVGPAVLQLAVRRQHMHVRSPVLLAVQHRRPGVLVRLHARPGDLLELLQRPLDLLPRRGVLRPPGDHPGFVRVLEL